MTFLYTGTDSFKLLIKSWDPYELKKNYTSAVFPLEPGKNEICLGKLKFKNGEWPCFEFNAKAVKRYKEKRINQCRSVKAKRLKKAFKNNGLENDFKDTILYEKPLRITQKQIKSTNLFMTTEDVEKDVILVHSNKRELFLGLNISWGYRGKKYQLLLSTLRNNNTPSRNTIRELWNVYPIELFNLVYLQQY